MEKARAPETQKPSLLISVNALAAEYSHELRSFSRERFPDATRTKIINVISQIFINDSYCSYIYVLYIAMISYMTNREWHR